MTIVSIVPFVGHHSTTHQLDATADDDYALTQGTSVSPSVRTSFIKSILTRGDTEGMPNMTRLSSERRKSLSIRVDGRFALQLHAAEHHVCASAPHAIASFPLTL